MKNLVKAFGLFLWVVFTVVPAKAVTLVEGSGSVAKSASTSEADSRYLNGELKGRYESGRLSTSVGEYQLNAGVRIDDRRPIAEWYKVPASASVQLKFKAERLVQVIIY